MITRSLLNRASICIAAALAVCWSATAANGDDLKEISDAFGWYALDDSTRILLEPSARGGIYVADFENYRSGRIDTEGGNYVWRMGKDPERAIEFNLTEDRSVEAFTWKSDSGEPGVAKKLKEGYGVEEVSFENGALQLSGTLYTPPEPGPHPAGVFIHGSGASDRDNLWYQTIIDRLVKSGIVVLLPDKRGTGKSEGEWNVASFADFAGDALAGVELVRSRAGVDPKQIGLIGISQGGWVAPLAATQSKGGVAFVADLCGSIVKPNEQIVHELGGGAVGRVRASVAKRRKPVWWEKNGDYDPIPYWQQLAVPGLIVYGEDDEKDNVPVKQCVKLFQEELAAKNNLTLQVYPRSGHALYDQNTGRIREDFLKFLVEWVKTGRQ